MRSDELPERTAKLANADRRPIRTVKFIMLAGLIALCPATDGLAADLDRGVTDRAAPYPDSRPGASIVVPDCAVRYTAVLMRCMPRDEVLWPDQTDLVGIEQTIDKPIRKPYRELYTPPLPGEPRRH